MKELFAALVVALLAPAYVAGNVVLVLAVRRWVWPALQRAWKGSEASVQHQLDALSLVRLWTTTALCAVALAVCMWLLRQELSLLSMACTVLGYLLVICALTLSLVARLPVAQKLWRDPAVRLCMLALPPFLWFVGKGYAGQWIGDLLGTSGANAAMALLAGTVFLLCLVPAAILGGLTLVFEVAALIVLLSAGFKDQAKRKCAWVVTLLTMFFGIFMGAIAGTQLIAAPLGRALMLAIVFEFDASPARLCALRDEERVLAQDSEPFIKALHLGSSQERRYCCVVLQRCSGLRCCESSRPNKRACATFRCCAWWSAIRPHDHRHVA